MPDPFKSMETRKDYSKARYRVEILDVTPNKKGELNIEGKQNQTVIPGKDFKPGIYFIRLIAGGVVMDTQSIKEEDLAQTIYLKMP